MESETTYLHQTSLQRLHIVVQGIVQGVGFRPFVYNQASRWGLTGFVLNNSLGVIIEVEGPVQALAGFRHALYTEPPALARIVSLTVETIPLRHEATFVILHSESGQERRALISPDTAACDECLHELFDSANRRYWYPFTNCTNCGPRFTIIQDVPYDRDKTTMRVFAMCPACQQEFENPLNRRFHAQPNACPICGPQVSLLTKNEAGQFCATESHGVIVQTAQFLAQGAIVAVKGLGGYHLACDALNAEAVQRLRQRKHRQAKPFALMVPDIETARQLGHVSSAEAMLLQTRQRPIVLIRQHHTCSVAPAVAPASSTLLQYPPTDRGYEESLTSPPASPDVDDSNGMTPNRSTGFVLGLMLPYTPLHSLLLQAFAETIKPTRPAVLVMTSGNLSEEPIAYKDHDAQERLQPIADCMLIHNREIHMRCDDSVMRVVGTGLAPAFRGRHLEEGVGASVGAWACPRPGSPLTSFSSGDNPPDPHGRGQAHTPTDSLRFGSEQVLRRSRGYAPEPLALPLDLPIPLLACGGHLKNTFCLGKERQAFISHHIGDLENMETLLSFRAGIEHFQHLFAISPQAIAYDLHPEYLATKYALDSDLAPKIGVQHHHAHIASVLAEHGLTEPVIGVAADGAGYGTDGAIWGCEILVADLLDFERFAHLAYVPLPGGEQAVHQPWRMAAVYLARAYGDAFLELDIPFVHHINRPNWHLLSQMIAKNLNCPQTSSLGRLFDAIAALIGLHSEVVYEGQAAIALEVLATRYPDPVTSYPFVVQQGKPALLDVIPLIDAIVKDIAQGMPAEHIAKRFHLSVAHMLVTSCAEVRQQTGLSKVALSGGVFQNQLLLEQLVLLLEENAFEVYINRLVPPNDGGLSLGQIAAAGARLQRDMREVTPPQ